MSKLKGPARRLGRNKWYIPSDRPDAGEEREYIKESETYRQLWHLYTELEQENAKLKERVEELELEKEAALDRQMSHCTWAEDADGNWDTACDNRHIFLDGGPLENHYRFCPYCGRPVTPRPEPPKPGKV